MPNPSDQRAKILIVDDEAEHADVLSEILREDGGHDIQSITDPRGAITLWHEFQPDLVILDLSMPHVGGMEVLSQLRSIASAETFLPILIVTAADSLSPLSLCRWRTCSKKLWIWCVRSPQVEG
jgi:CheY-like chemotaxis protein